MTRRTNATNCQFRYRLSTGNSMSWSDKLDVLLQNFDVARIANGGGFKAFFIDGQQVGLIRPDFWLHLANYPHAFHYDASKEKVTLNPEWRTYDERTEKMDVLLRELRKKNVFKTLCGWRDECYDVSAKFGDVPLMKMERSATCLFGIKRCGVHVNGYVAHKGGTKSVWLQTRAFKKPTWPGKLDSMVSGGFAVGMTVTECVRKEAEEEASLSEELLNTMKPVGTVSFIFEDDRGLFPETLFVFDIEVPLEFIPKNANKEVERFHLCGTEELKRVIVTKDFKLTSSLVALDFLVRHGHLNCDDEPNYTKLLETVHTPLHHMSVLY